MLRAFTDFVDEATSVASTGSCTNPLNIYIEGQKKESVLIWDMIKHVASLQEALMESDHIRQHHEIDRSSVFAYQDEPFTLDFTAMQVRFQLPWDLPPSFYLSRFGVSLRGPASSISMEIPARCGTPQARTPLERIGPHSSSSKNGGRPFLADQCSYLREEYRHSWQSTNSKG
jgi:hypothetical protein